MSQQAVTWVLNDAPVTDSTQLIILITLAFRANNDGTCAYLSEYLLANRARCSLRTVRRHIRSLEEAGVIRRGNQDLVAWERPDLRPVVWNLAVERTRADEV